jgi:TolB protein
MVLRRSNLAVVPFASNPHGSPIALRRRAVGQRVERGLGPVSSLAVSLAITGRVRPLGFATGLFFRLGLFTAALAAVWVCLGMSAAVAHAQPSPTKVEPSKAAAVANPEGKAPANSAGPTVPTLSPLESEHLANLRQVTQGMVKAGEGYFSPDGRDIVYQAVPQDYPFYQIYTQPFAGGPPRLVSTGRGRTTCSYFSPDGKRLLFASSHLDPQLEKTETAARARQEEDRRTGARRRYEWDFDPFMDLFESDLDGGNRKQLTSAYGYDAEGAYSKDGKLIAFCRDSEADPKAPVSDARPKNPDIYLMNADGSKVRRLTSAPGYDGGPFISPDGQWIVFRSDRKKESYLQLYVIGIDGKNETALTDNDGVNWGPYWHPTKPLLVWSGADHSNPNARPNYDLWIMRYSVEKGRMTPGKITRLTDSPAADVLPVFSPDGQRLMWTSTRAADRSSQLFTAELRGF